tara:strand:+ start:2155 stop:2319 length:165 start_codon:yes stop_codon:yes gene_type:complete
MTLDQANVCMSSQLPIENLFGWPICAIRDLLNSSTYRPDVTRRFVKNNERPERK